MIEADTRSCGRLHLRIALDYGARHEIVEAVRSLALDIARQRLQLEQITEEKFMSRLSSEGIPDPDLIIRTAGERRLSNFLLWQAAYSEFYFTPKLWPDFESADLEDAIADFNSRTRKFGALACATAS
jgi:undecaprenyl diphosphate synthase